MLPKIGFNVHEGNSTYRVENEELVEYAKLYGLETLIPGRYSWLFVFNLLMLEQKSGVEPFSIIDEIKNIEGLGPSRQTKPASEFRGPHLKGLWHKHFFAANPSLLAHNITNQLAGGKLEKLVAEVLDPNKSPVVTKEMIDELSHRVVVESLEDRAADSKLTGEWIVFAKHQGQNYYLCLTTHESGDENIAQSIKAACLPQFTFLNFHVS